MYVTVNAAHKLLNGANENSKNKQINNIEGPWQFRYDYALLNCCSLFMPFYKNKFVINQVGS